MTRRQEPYTNTQTFSQSNQNTGTNWLRDNFWNLLITFVTLIVAWATMSNKISYLETRAQNNFDNIEKIQDKIDSLPDTKTLQLELDPIKSDLSEVKKDLKTLMTK